MEVESSGLREKGRTDEGTEEGERIGTNRREGERGVEDRGKEVSWKRNIKGERQT